MSEIGKQTPKEVLQECIDLYGEFLKSMNNVSQEVYWDILEDMIEYVENNSEIVKDFQTSDYKWVLNVKLRRGPETVGDHADILKKAEEVKKEANRIQEENKKEESQICRECDRDRVLRKFPFQVGSKDKRQTTCKDCLLEKQRKLEEEQAAAEKIEAEKKAIEEEKCDRVETKRYPRREEKSMEDKTEKEVAEEDLGPGLYFMSVILKCNVRNKLYHVTDQFHAASTAEAIGTMIMRPECKNEIIISIGYEKAIHNTDV